MKTEKLARQIMLVFTNMSKHHTKTHNQAHTKKSEMAILSILESQGKEDGIMITEISKLLNLPPSAITPVINTMEDKGYVARQNSPEDRRIVLVTLTEKGLDFFNKKQEFFYKKTLQLVEYLGEKDAAEFLRLFKKSFDFLKRIEEEHDSDKNACS